MLNRYIKKEFIPFYINKLGVEVIGQDSNAVNNSIHLVLFCNKKSKIFFTHVTIRGI